SPMAAIAARFSLQSCSVCAAHSAREGAGVDFAARDVDEPLAPHPTAASASRASPAVNLQL
ncbi:MAG TPA: hypothetical protein VGH24_10185, partial [Solirubrobacteraceae bacterium]